MDAISKFRDLEDYGIRYLTGEADALSFRGLCDLTRTGVKIVGEFFGFDAEALPENWNSGAVRSILLDPRDWRGLGVIALFHSGAILVVETSSGLFGFRNADDFQCAEFEFDEQTGFRETKGPEFRYREGSDLIPWPAEVYGEIQRTYSYGGGPRSGSRNVHAMSGRVV